MALETYADLKAAVAAWLNRTDLTAIIPDFITLAEAYLNRELKTRQQTASTTLVTTGGVATVDLPDDFGMLRSATLLVDPKRALEPMTLGALTARYNFSAGGAPRACAVQGNTLRFGPAPDATYNVEFLYFQRIPPLSGDNTENWLLNAHPDAYLYAALTQAAPYLGDDPRIAVWGSLLERVIDAINAEDSMADLPANAATTTDLPSTP